MELSSCSQANVKSGSYFRPVPKEQDADKNDGNQEQGEKHKLKNGFVHSSTVTDFESAG
jgi:hypothetical protein